MKSAIEQINEYLNEKARLESEATEGPWRWLDCCTLVGDYGSRPVVLTTNGDLEVRGPDGLLHLLSIDGSDPKFIVRARNNARREIECMRVLVAALDLLAFVDNSRPMSETASKALEQAAKILRGGTMSQSDTSSTTNQCDTCSTEQRKIEAAAREYANERRDAKRIGQAEWQRIQNAWIDGFKSGKRDANPGPEWVRRSEVEALADSNSATGWMIKYQRQLEESEKLKAKLDIKKLVDRFLAWPLPGSVCVDLCAREQNYPNRYGTTLLTADEARQMLEYLLSDS